MNLGAIRILLIRATPVVSVVSLLLIAVFGAPLPSWCFILLAAVFIPAVFFDAKRIFSQELEYQTQKNPEWIKLMKMMETLKNQNGISVSYTNPNWTKTQDD